MRRRTLALVGDVGREEVNQHAEQRESGDAVASQNPCAATLAVRYMWRLCGWGTVRGPMLHENLPKDGNIVARLASRLKPAKNQTTRILLPPASEGKRKISGLVPTGDSHSGCRIVQFYPVLPPNTGWFFSAFPCGTAFRPQRARRRTEEQLDPFWEVFLRRDKIRLFFAVEKVV